MSEREDLPRVGVRELRQNLSVYLRRVKAGETLEVTEQGTSVGLLTPLPAKRRTRLEQLVESGDAIAPSRTIGDLPMPPRANGRPLSVVLQELRDDDRA